MKINEVIFFEKEAIVKFLQNHGKEKTKDYELAATLIIHHFCEKQWGEKCWIGVRIKEKYLKLLPAVNSKEEVLLEKIAEFLRNCVDEDSLIDFVVVKEANIGKARGMIFQVKRFGIGRIKKNTEEMIKYLNSDKFKLPKTDINLLICLDDGVNIDTERLYTGVNMDKFPFNRILFTWLSAERVYIKDIYPQGNTESYPIIDLYS